MTISFLVAGSVCAVTALCYAELASMVPVSGSAYIYTYAVLGELAAWVIGWALTLEYTEIFEDLPDVDCVIAPYGGGGLSVGIASYLKAMRPSIRVYACETEAGRPAAFAIKGVPGDGPVVCVVSGGHLDPAHICAILGGAEPPEG